MNLQVNETNSILSKAFISAQNYTNKLLGDDDREFAKYLKNNFEVMDYDKNNELSKNEIEDTLRTNDHPELQKLLENKSIESIIANIDTNNDNSISVSEVDVSGNVKKALKSGLEEYNSTKDLSSTAKNMAGKLCQAYLISDQMQGYVNSALSYVL